MKKLSSHKKGSYLRVAVSSELSEEHRLNMLDAKQQNLVKVTNAKT